MRACLQRLPLRLVERGTPERLLPVTALPFWDIKASVDEITRCAQLGHKSILFPSQPQDFGFAPLAHTDWDPVGAVAEEAGLPISFHIGSQEWLGTSDGNPFSDPAGMGIHASFERQVYGCFWFEREMLSQTIERYPNNILYETDFAHPTSMSPGPATPAVAPRQYASEVLGKLPRDLAGKILHDNAARVYHLE